MQQMCFLSTVRCSSELFLVSFKLVSNRIHSYKKILQARVLNMFKFNFCMEFTHRYQLQGIQQIPLYKIWNTYTIAL